MGRLEQFQQAIAVADTMAAALLDDWRDKRPADYAKVKEIRQDLQKALYAAKRLGQE